MYRGSLSGTASVHSDVVAAGSGSARQVRAHDEVIAETIIGDRGTASRASLVGQCSLSSDEV